MQDRLLLKSCILEEMLMDYMPKGLRHKAFIWKGDIKPTLQAGCLWKCSFS